MLSRALGGKGRGLRPTGRSQPYPGPDKTVFPKGMLTMAWIVLVLSGVFEAVWATALGKSHGFTRLLPSVIFAAALVASMSGLAYAMRTLPVGTSYAVWVGIGAALTVLYAMVTGTEQASLLKLLLLVMIVAGVVGLKVTG